MVPTNSLAEVSAALDADPVDTQDAELLGHVMMLRAALENLSDMEQQMERRFPALDDGHDWDNEHDGS